MLTASKPFSLSRFAAPAERRPPVQKVMRMRSIRQFVAAIEEVFERNVHCTWNVGAIPFEGTAHVDDHRALAD